MKCAPKILLFILLTASMIFEAVGQNNVYNNMSLDEILDVDVVITASKKPEDLFETPLSTTIIKKEDILKAGVTSIPEALRLAPGLIVREITPGNYDVHIRGYDDITKNVYISLPYNTTTLVMIDNRIVYNYFTGGTLWETFPIDLNDIEQIEVVRGPASALYGPNAVTGVINIITTHAKNKGMNASANVIGGTYQAKGANANIGYNWNEKTKLSFSGNFTERHRFDEGYFDFNSNSYTPINDMTMMITPIKNYNTKDSWTFKEYQEALGAYYDEDVSLRKLGGNIFLHHTISNQSSIDITVGAQKSQSQKTGFYNLVTPISQIESQSFYFDSKMKYKNFSGQFNINSGEDLSNYKFNSYKYTNVDSYLDYYKQFGNFSIRPGISFKGVNYNSPLIYNEPLSWTLLNYQFKKEYRLSNTFAASFLTEWKPKPKVRFIGAIRVDKTTINKNYSINYEIASTYRINKNNLLRYVFSVANKSPFIFDSYLNSSMSLNLDYQAESNVVPVSIPVSFNINGNEDLKYPAITSQEISWRTKLFNNMNLDIELFNSKVNNLVNPNVYNTRYTVQQLNNFGEIDSIISVSSAGDVRFENYDLTARQYGASFTFDYEYSNKINVKIYGTYQKTKISGRTGIDFETTRIKIGTPTPENTIAVEIDTKMNPTQWSEDLTPSFFGGFIFNYKPFARWNFSTDAYMYTDQQFANYNYYEIADEASLQNAKVQMAIKSKMIFNAKASFQVNKNVKAYSTIKNILGNHYEYGFADEIGTLFIIGVQWEL
jgi:iron complex outermembrane receptor protein